MIKKSVPITLFFISKIKTNLASRGFSQTTTDKKSTIEELQKIQTSGSDLDQTVHHIKRDIGYEHQHKKYNLKIKSMF